MLRLNLWPVVNTGESNMTPMGSTALNPDGNNSAVLYIELDTYAHPVAFPTGGLGEETQMYELILLLRFSNGGGNSACPHLHTQISF